MIRELVRFIGGSLFVTLLACNPSTNTEQESNNHTQNTNNSVNVPDFQADSAYFFVEQQVKFGPRVPGTKGHKACKEWIVKKLEQYGAKVTVQKTNIKTYNGREYEIYNIIGSYGEQATGRIMLSAHWDTRPFADEDSVRKNEPILGANDAGSGVAVLLEIARQLGQQKPSVGIDLCFWDAEDMGNADVEDSYCLGSQYWAKNPHQPGYKASYGINLDMVGAKNAQFPQEGVSLKYAKGVLDKVWSTAHQLGYGGYFIFQEAAPITDDHYYINTLAGIPMIDIIHKDITKDTFFPEWHTHQDDLPIIDKNTLKAVGQTLLNVFYHESPNL